MPLGRRKFSRPSRLIGFEPLETRLALSGVVSDVLISSPSHGAQIAAAHDSAVAALQGGGYVATYSGRGAADRDGVYFRLIDPDGQPNDAAHLVNETLAGHQGSATVDAFPSGGFIVAWSGRGRGDRVGIFARHFDASGQPVTAEYRVNQTVGGSQVSPAIAVGAGGDFTVAWSGPGNGDAYGIYFRRFDAFGNPLGDETLVNDPSPLVQDHVALTNLADGNLWFAWSSRGQDGEGWDVYSREFADDQPVAQETRINQSTTAEQHSPSVALMADDTLVVTWSSNHNQVSGFDVIARIAEPGGGILSDELVVNQTPTNNQIFSKVASGPDAGFTVAWQSAMQDGSGWGVVSRRFQPNGIPQAEEIQVNGFSAASQARASLAISENGGRVVIWSGVGTVDRRGVYAQLIGTDVPTRKNHAPVLDAIDRQSATVGMQFVVAVSATDIDGDNLTFQLDPDGAPLDAVIEQTGPTTAVIRWTPAEGDAGQTIAFRVLVTDDGVPPLADAESFEVIVGQSNPAMNHPPVIDLIDSQFATVGMQFVVAVSATDIDGDNLTFQLDPDGAPLDAVIEQTGPTTAVIRWTPAEGDAGQTIAFRVLVTDDGVPPLADAESFEVLIGQLSASRLPG